MEGRILAKPEPGTKMVCIVGPTAVGKTAVAVRIAPGLSAEIVSADAMQVYRGMDIGTGKPSLDEQAGVPFHMLDIAGRMRTSRWLVSRSLRTTRCSR